MTTSLYVAPTGSDSNNGSASAPFQTILAASQHALPGTVVHVAPGTYAGGFTTSASGTATARITYVSDTPGAAVIVGSSNGADTAWWNKGSYVDIKGFTVDGSGSAAASWTTGLYGTGSHDTLVGNTVHDMLTDPTAFAKAEASGNGGAAIELDNYNGGTDGLIDGNLVYNIGPAGQTSSTVQGIYMTQVGTVSNNVVHDIVGTGVHLWHGAANINIFNNTINNARGGGILVGSGDSGATATTGDYVNVANNIVTNSVYGITEEGTTGIHNTYVDNLVYANSQWNVKLQNGLKATGTITADPKFANAAAGDYRLQAGSPAIGASYASETPATDFTGATRSATGGYDIGAFETLDGGTTTTPAPAPAPITTRTLQVKVSEDYYQGNAKFIVAVDGKQIGTTQTATVRHASGNWQTVNLSVALAAGQHDVAVTFLNDAYGGTASTDRNLYVGGISLGGVAATDTPYAMMSAGTHHSTITLPT